MARVTIPLPFASVNLSTAVRLSWRDLDNGLGLVTSLRSTGVESWLTDFFIRDEPDSEFALRIGDSLPDNVSRNGQDLTNAWETYASAITLQNDHIAIDLVLPGPRNISNDFIDALETYSWRPPAAKFAEAGTWITAWRALTDSQKDDTRVILDDGQLTATATAEAEATATATADLMNPGLAVRNPDKDIALGHEIWIGAASDGTTLWLLEIQVFGGATARAYRASTQARDSSKDISLTTTSGWTGAISDGTTLWFNANLDNTARAYNAATQARDSSKDISFGDGTWRPAASDGTTLWFVNTEESIAYAYVAATRVRDSSKDITLGGPGSVGELSSVGWGGGASDGTTLWFANNTDDIAYAYVASTQARDSARDISHKDLAGSLYGGVVAEGTIWFVEPDPNRAIAFDFEPYRTATATAEAEADATATATAGFETPPLDATASADAEADATATATASLVSALTLADAVVPDGRAIVGLGSLIQVPADGDVYDSDATVLDGDDPPSLGASDLTPTRIYLTGRTQLRISDSGAGDIEAIFSAGGAQENYQVHVQTSFGASSRVDLGASDIDAGRSTAARLILGADGDPDGVFDDVGPMAIGSRVLFFLTQPALPLDAIVTADAEADATAAATASLGDAPPLDATVTVAAEAAAVATATASLGLAPRLAIVTAEAEATATATATASLGEINYSSQQCVNLGPTPFGFGSSWTGSIEIQAALLDGEGPAFLREIGTNQFGNVWTLRLAISATAEPGDAGPDLSSDVEGYVGAFVFTEESAGSLTMPGPHAPGTLFMDDDEPYTWNVGDAANDLPSWLQNLGTGDVTLCIQDGPAPYLGPVLDATASADAEADAAASATASLGQAPPLDASGSAAAEAEATATATASLGSALPLDATVTAAAEAEATATATADLGDAPDLIATATADAEAAAEATATATLGQPPPLNATAAAAAEAEATATATADLGDALDLDATASAAAAAEAVATATADLSDAPDLDAIVTAAAEAEATATATASLGDAPDLTVAGTAAAEAEATASATASLAAAPGLTATAAADAEVDATASASADLGPLPLTLADAVVPDGRAIVGLGSLIQVPADGDIYDSDATVLDGDDPPSLGAERPDAYPDLRHRQLATADLELRRRRHPDDLLHVCGALERLPDSCSNVGRGCPAVRQFRTFQ